MSNFLEINALKNLEPKDLLQIMEAWRIQVEKDTQSVGVRLPIQESPVVAIEIWRRILAGELTKISPSQRYSLAYIADVPTISSDHLQAALQLLQRGLIKVLTRRHFS